MDASIIAAIVAACSAVAVALINGIMAMDIRKARVRDDQREKLAMAQYDVSAAQTDGLRILLRHAHGEHLNGDVERAIAALDSSEAAYTRLRTEIVSKSTL